MRKLVWYVGVAVLFGTGPCGSVEAAAQDPPDGKALYGEHCAKCHGANLEGGEAPSLIDGVWLYGTGNSQRIRNIRFGILQQGMPGFNDALSRKQIDALSDYIGEMEKAAGSERPPLPEVLNTYDYEIRVERFAEGLTIPWAIDFLDDRTALVTERPGTLRIVRDGKLLEAGRGDSGGPVRGTGRFDGRCRGPELLGKRLDLPFLQPRAGLGGRTTAGDDTPRPRQAGR